MENNGYYYVVDARDKAVAGPFIDRTTAIKITLIEDMNKDFERLAIKSRAYLALRGAYSFKDEGREALKRDCENAEKVILERNPDVNGVRCRTALVAFFALATATVGILEHKRSIVRKELMFDNDYFNYVNAKDLGEEADRPELLVILERLEEQLRLARLDEAARHLDAVRDMRGLGGYYGI